MPKCISCHIAIMVLTRGACCIKIEAQVSHILSSHPFLCTVSLKAKEYFQISSFMWNLSCPNSKFQALPVEKSWNFQVLKYFQTQSFVGNHTAGVKAGKSTFILFWTYYHFWYSSLSCSRTPLLTLLLSFIVY